MSNSKKRKNSFKGFLARMVITLIAALGIRDSVKQLNEAKQLNIIEEEASREVGRNIDLIKKDNMTEQLKNYISFLKQKYPNFTELLNTNDESMLTDEFVNDMYTLFKVYLAGNRIDDINNFKPENLKIIILDSAPTKDRLYYYVEGEIDENLLDTSKDVYLYTSKMFDDLKNDKSLSIKFRNTIYETFINELGTVIETEKGEPLTSKKIDELIDRNENDINSFKENLKRGIYNNGETKNKMDGGNIVKDNNDNSR